jgi:hypothetical protein
MPPKQKESAWFESTGILIDGYSWMTLLIYQPGNVTCMGDTIFRSTLKWHENSR